MGPVPPPLWLMLLEAAGIVVLAAIASFIVIGSGIASVMIALAFGLPRVVAVLDYLIIFVERVSAWTRHNLRGIVVSLITSGLLSVASLWQWYFYWDTSDVPDMMEMVRYAPPQIGYVYDRNGDVMIELASVFRKPVQYNELPLALERATIAAEDKDFYEHDGIPVLCVSAPFAQNQVCLPVAAELLWRWVSGKGGSTLTMQLVRNHYLADMMALERSDTLVVDNRLSRWVASFKGVPWVNRRVRKLREIKYALHLERQLTDYAQRQIDAEMQNRGVWYVQRAVESRTLAKRRAKELLMARYLSTVYYGYSMYGPDSASRFYFNRPMTDLSVDEAALLASFAPAPSRYAQLADVNGARAQQKMRRDRIIRRMGEKGFISSAYDCGRPDNWWDAVRWFVRNELPRGDCVNEVALYRGRAVSLIGRIPGGRTEAPASVQTALDEIEERGFSDRKLFDGTIRIHTTADLQIQAVVNNAAMLGAHLYTDTYGTERGQPQIAIIVLRNRDAAILGQFGGFTDHAPNNWTHLDRSRKSWRQPGSIFKVFVYLSALSSGGHTADSLVNDDAPYPVRMGGGGRHYVHNYTNDYRGWMPFREAVAQSRNVPAMRVGMEYTTVPAIIETAHKAGIVTPLKNEPSTILGSGDITVIELANAFRTIASGGIYAKPYIIDRVTNSFGEELARHNVETTVADIPRTAIVTLQELLRGAVRLPSGTARAMQTLRDVPLLCKTGTSNRFADARITCSTYGPDGITVSVWTGLDDSTRTLGDKASGGKLTLPVAQHIFSRLYTTEGSSREHALLAIAPRFPEDMEFRIDDYIGKAYPKP